MWLIKKWVNNVLFNSIRRRTLLFVMGIFSLTSLLVMIIGMWFANHEVEELFDARLAQQARLLLILSERIEKIESSQQDAMPLIIDLNDTDASVGHKYESKIFYQIWQHDELKIASDTMSFKHEEQELAGYGYAMGAEYSWRTFTLKDDYTKTQVVVAERADVRGEISEQIVFQTLFPEILAFPILAFLVWAAVGFGIEPLQQLAQRIKNISPTKLKPIEMSYIPDELAPVQSALNTLLIEVDVLMEREKRWIADAAHELRTPLSILRVHAENAASAETENERTQSLHQLTVGVDRATRIVSQLLALARLEHQKNVAREQVDVLAISRSMIADILPLAWKRKVEINLDSDESLDWRCYVEANHVEIILQNLLSNAIKFSPDNSQIQVSWTQSASNVELCVIDYGAGVSQEEKQRLSERFYRASQVEGAGLGLSIVKNIVDKYQGTLSFDTSVDSGLKVRIMLPIRGVI